MLFVFVCVCMRVILAHKHVHYLRLNIGQFFFSSLCRLVCLSRISIVDRFVHVCELVHTDDCER